MAAWCLPRNLSTAFLQALKDGTLDPDELVGMTSEGRRAEFAKIVGDDNAREVNAQFESGMLLKNQKQGLVNWAKRIGGLNETTRRDMISQITKLDHILNPAEETAFMEDLAAKRLGISVTADEAKQVFLAAQKAEAIKNRIIEEGEGDYAKGWNPENGTVYGKAVQDLRELVDSLKPHNIPWQDRVLSAVNLPREIQTSVFHSSAPFVQLWGMISNGVWYRGIRQMFEYMLSENRYRDSVAYILGHPKYQQAMDDGLALTQLGDTLTKAEEGLQSHLLLDANTWIANKYGLPNTIRSFQRSFVGVNNYVRFQRYTELIKGMEMAGEDAGPGSKISKDMADVVNAFTGRANEVSLPTSLKAGQMINPVSLPRSRALSTILYAPRKLAATFEMFNPAFYARLSPQARMVAARQLIGSLMVTASVITLAKYSGAHVELDPRSSDFGKINIGGEKLDITGGNSSYIRFWSRMITNHTISSTGVNRELGLPYGPSRADVLTQFFRNKLSPVAAMIADGIYGSDPIGRPITPAGAAYEELTPIVIHSLMDFMMNNPNDTAAYFPALSAFLGVGLESPLPPPSENGRNPWGQPVNQFQALGTPDSWRNDPVNKEAYRLGVSLSFPSRSVHGVKLTDHQYTQYITAAGQLAHMRLEQMVADPNWSNGSPITRAKQFKSVIKKAREQALVGLMGRYHGSDNDIVRGARQAKQADLERAQRLYEERAQTQPAQ